MKTTTTTTTRARWVEADAGGDAAEDDLV
jgi:hypothetical protein